MARGNITQSDFGGGYYEARRKRGAERFDTLRDLVHASAQEGLAKKRRAGKVPDKIESIAKDLEGGWEI